jgi:Spy/CpxP family protein refolding chaperone
MTNKALALLLVFSLAFNIAFVGIWAHGRVGRRARREPWAELRLSPEQQKLVREGWDQVRRQLHAYRAEAAAQREELLGLLAADEPDQQAILSAQERIDITHRRMREVALGEMIRTGQALTPDQRQAWLRSVRVRARRFGRGPGRGGRPPSEARRPGQASAPAPQDAPAATAVGGIEAGDGDDPSRTLERP